MDDSVCENLDPKSLDLLNIFYFQHDYKYKFRPDVFNDLIISKEKLTTFSPKSCKLFKKVVKFKSIKNKKLSKQSVNQKDIKSFKKIQDEQNVNDALQEATVLDRISNLKKNGIWTRDALPKLMEPSRYKAHWDYLIEENEWLAIDMKNRLKWKMLAAKMLAESAKAYVFVKEEIKTLEFIQLQEEARLNCGIVAKMIKEWWWLKETASFTSKKYLNDISDDSSMDFCQMWLSENLINADHEVKMTNYLCDKSDSDSLCSFQSFTSHCSIMLSEEENIYIDNSSHDDENSFDLSHDYSSNTDLNDELNWLESDMNFYDSQTKMSYENEINELKILSQTPLEKIVDENYFLHTGTIDGKSINSSDILDSDESIMSDALSIDVNEILVKSELKSPCFIVSQNEKIQEYLAITFSETIFGSNNGILDQILRNDMVNKNIQILYELVKEKISFSIVSSLQCGDDRILISVLLAYLSQKMNFKAPELIITTKSQIYEWQTFLKKIFPDCRIIILDSFTSLKSAHKVLELIDSTEPKICIISYAKLVCKFSISSVKWNNIIYDQVEKICEKSYNLSETFYLSNNCLFGVRIGLISEDNDFPSKNHCINSYFRLFYTTVDLDELLNDFQYCQIGKIGTQYTEKLNTVVLNHCVPLKRIFDPGSNCQIVMCQLTEFQKGLHGCVVEKLKKTLISNNLLDIVEAVCQDIQLSQHPFLFDCCSDSGETLLFNSFRRQFKSGMSMPSYQMSNSDTLSIYVPKKILSTLLSLREFKFRKISNFMLPYNIYNLPIFHLSKYERGQMKHLLVCTTNIDYLLNKIYYLTENDDDHHQNTNVVENVSKIIQNSPNKSEFLSFSDLENLKFEMQNFTDNGFQKFLNCSSRLISECCNDIDNVEKDLQMSSTLAARRSKTKFKSRLTSLSKENEKYSMFLDCSDCCYSLKNILSIDLSIRINELDCLQNLCSVSQTYLESITNRYNVMHNKVIARSPKIVYNQKSKLLLSNNDYQLVQAISRVFQASLIKTPTINSTIYRFRKEEIYLSGKLQTLNSIILQLANDSTIKTCVIISHSFELLNIIEAMIFINKNYGTFLKFRLKSCGKENDEQILSIIDKFKKYQIRNKKSILLVHSRTNYQLLSRLNPDNCSIIIVDSHWQMDSDKIIFKLINRWGLNSILSPGNGISSIYRLCSFETLEPYFLTNDLGFLYDNSYYDPHGSSTSAIVSQQSLLKGFIDKLFPHLKDDLLSALNMDDYYSNSQKKENLVKISEKSIADVFNSFENPYDLLQICMFQSAKRLLMYEFKHLMDEDHKFISNEKFQQTNADNYFDLPIDNTELLRKRESYRIKRQNKLSHLLEFSEDHDSFLFYDKKQLQLQCADIWSPPQLNETLKIVPNEVRDMYGSKPIKDTELSSYLIPTKSYLTKSDHKIWNDKNSIQSVVIKEDNFVKSEYLDVDRIKKRKLSSDYQIGEYSQYSLTQKKRKIFTNRRYTENETEMTSQSNLKTRYKIEKKNINESEIQSTDVKEIIDLKKSSPPICEPPLVDNNTFPVTNQSSIINSNSTISSSEVGKSNSIILCTSDNLMKISVQRPFYSKEGLRTLKIKRQQISSGNISNLPTKSNVQASSSIQGSYVQQPRPAHNNRPQLFINNKPGNNSEVSSNGETEYEKLPEWNIHEEAVLYQNISHYQDHQFSTNISDKLNSSPNFKLCEHYLNFYAITNTHRSSDMCKIHFTKLQMGFLNQNKGDNNLARLNRQTNIPNTTGAQGIRSTVETRPVIGGVTGRKLKIKMKNSIGTYGTSIFGSSQAMTNKIKMFQCFLNDMKVNLTQTNQIVNSCLKSFDSKTTMTFNMLDEVVNSSKLPSLLPNHSQTIKKNATHISALEEHNIHPDKIFTPAMLIQRREEMDKERESESNSINSNQNRQILTPVSSYRNTGGYFDSNAINSSAQSLNHIRRTASANIGTSQNLYALQSTSNSQVVSRARYNLPNNRQITGATVIHQQNSNPNQSVSAMVSNNTNSSNNVTSQTSGTTLGSRSQSVQFQIQHTRNATSIPRRTTSQQVFQRVVYPASYPLRQNQLLRNPTTFARPIVPTVVNQSNSQNSTTNNSIISVFPNSHDQTTSGINRTLDRSVNFNITGPTIRGGHSVRANIATVSSSSRGNQLPRLLHVNQINRNNNTINRNQE